MESPELLFVDDGSKDHTKDILRALSLKDDRCEFVLFLETSVKKLPCLPD